MLVVGKGAASGKEVNFQRCWLPVSRIGLHRRVSKESTAVQSCWTWVKGRLFFLYVVGSGPKGIRPCPSR